MTVGAIAVADAASPDARLHTNTRTISSVVRSDQYVLGGQPAYPTYAIRSDAVSVATTNSHLLQIMGDGTNYSRLLRYSVHFTDDRPAANTTIQIGLVRLSTAGTGGTAVNDYPHDTADSYGGDMRTIPGVKGTEVSTVHHFYLNVPTAFPGSMYEPLVWEAPRGAKPIVFGNAITDGLAWKVISGVASAKVDVSAELIVTSYL